MGQETHGPGTMEFFMPSWFDSFIHGTNIYFTFSIDEGHAIEQNRVFALKNLKSQSIQRVLGLLGHMVVVFQVFLRNIHTVLQSDCIVTFPLTA